jgi:hypothetical protein
MHDKESPFPIADSNGRLECKELWGGIRNRDLEISAGKSSVLSILNPVVKGVRVETSTILESAKVTR